MTTPLKLLALAAVAVLLTAGCIGRKNGEVPKQIGAEELERIGGRYNASIVIVGYEFDGKNYTRENIDYVKDGESFSAYFDENMRDALEWLKSNTAGDAVILCWWDYGGMIEGYTGRDVVIKASSRKMLRTVAKYARLSDSELEEIECENCEPHEKLSDVAEALTTTNPEKTIEIMNRYGSEFLLVHTSDKDKLYAILFAIDKNPEDYISNGKMTEKASETVLARAILEQPIEGFELAYEDDSVRVYHHPNP